MLLFYLFRGFRPTRERMNFDCDRLNKRYVPFYMYKLKHRKFCHLKINQTLFQLYVLFLETFMINIIAI